MPTFLYRGEYPERGFVDVYGVVFHPETPANITDPFAVAKVRGNRFFEELTNGDIDESGHPQPNIAEDAGSGAGPDSQRRRGRPRRSTH
jgi:hypothetical protein